MECKTCTGTGIITKYGQDRHDKYKCPACNGSGQAYVRKEVVKGTNPIIEFAVWYSGMSYGKVKAAYQRYLIENNNNCSDWVDSNEKNLQEEPYTSKYCEGEKCHCGKPALHKISEVIFDDDPNPRHEYTQYVCQEHFNRALRPYLFKSPTIPEVKAALGGGGEEKEDPAYTHNVKAASGITELHSSPKPLIHPKDIDFRAGKNLNPFNSTPPASKTLQDCKEFLIKRLNMTPLQAETLHTDYVNACFEYANHLQGMEWISVEDRLPEYNQEIVCYVPDLRKACITYYNHFEEWNNTGFHYRGVTHWMPLPNPPQSK